ncbi:HNH endonuclease signature motif containing protein [[Mycobacterium] burgundiense]|uniref:DUF222 domain-containing protein n=1 Tax=[Mycobacterium] burgundiense TaxID=3064286 RepID=A0ABM9LP67_9MYCO|nr:HNH endonuclease signature motif containing protein [Mycolicibacterium sp. MU0053]CAJ1502339.1 DUF222 domain-containing protein [Mycolicibacterium sp. MU0053]
MFESLPSPASLAGADDAAVVAAIEAGSRAESGAAATRLAAIAELMERRLGDDEDERGLWACDGWDSAAAEIAAALGISHRRASSQMHLAYALRTRLPRTAARLAEGAISLAIAATIAWRTRLVVDSDAMATIDSELAIQATRWGPLSEKGLDNAIDAVLEEHDPSARYEYNAAIRYRDVQFGKPDDATGTSSLYGSLKSPDAVLFDRRLRAMIRGVCSDDPRTIGERRSDAVGALLAGSDRLACRCGKPECVGAGTDSRADSVVIHVVADERAVQSAHTAKPEATPTKDPYYAAVLQGGGVVPPAQLAELIDAGAKISPLRAPDQTAEPRYRPSAKLARFIRARDLTCRFPGCSASAEICDVDHTIPDERGGPTHPSNLACLCRKHHLLKTFWSEWSETQHPDGSITWTTPTGKTYTTYPGSKAVFPHWDTTTAPLPAPDATRPAAPIANRGLQMPRRKRTRRAEQAQRIKSERARHDSG